MELRQSPKEPKTPTPRKAKKIFSFKRPPEAPVFTPSEEEFENPFEYINKIRAIGEKAGICKIIPPSSWKPPFVLDKDNLHFTPRIQRINELEAGTRLKLNFIDQLTKFFAHRGKTFQNPVVEKRRLDLYTLHRIVKELGGIEEVNKEKKWNDIASRMNCFGKTSPTLIKNHYDNLIHPFLQSQSEIKKSNNGEVIKNTNDFIDESPKAKKFRIDGEEEDKARFTKVPFMRELKSLRFLGPGPKMAVCDDNNGINSTMPNRTRGRKIFYEFDPLAKYMCKCCRGDDIEEVLLSCETCKDRYHNSCLIPPLQETPEEWKCPKCSAEEVCKPLEDFGFSQAEREYTLTEFQQMANEFKKNYFKSDPHLVPTEKVEEEFWRVVSSIDASVTVEYGADLHVIDHGSGFPRKNNPCVPGIDKEEYEKYANSPWNLNNLPVLTSSVLRHISADISGMKIPWMYAGMCFATFCWHNEDHWSYSINYLHMGDPKTWYGVSGSNAEKFERAMQAAAPELFEAQPDLLHHLVTIMNPNDLMTADVPVFRTDQKEGEFVITFPRAYHAGFNQGFNFAEACNFAPYDWLQVGRECILHYSALRRPCVFSHDELVCSMALTVEDLDRDIAEATMKDMITMVETESIKLTRAANFGIQQIMDFSYEGIPDDLRQCCECNTTVFLSAVVCPCSRTKLVCLDHVHKLCNCPPNKYIMNCQFRMHFLREIVDLMKCKVFRFGDWRKRVENALSNNNQEKISLRALTELLIEAKEKDFPHNELIDLLDLHVRKSIDCSALARALINNSLAKTSQNMVTVQDLVMFCNEIENLPCTISEYGGVKQLLNNAKKFQRIAAKLISKKLVNKPKLLSCIRMGKSLHLDLTEIPFLESKLKEIGWIERANEILATDKEVELEAIQNILDLCQDIPITESISQKKEELKLYFETVKICKERWSLINICERDINEVGFVLKESEKFHLNLPNKDELMEELKVGNSLQDKLNQVLNGKIFLYLEELESLITQSKSFTFKMKCIVELENILPDIRDWIEEAKKLFLKENSNISLIQAFWPRKFISRTTVYLKRNNNIENFEIPKTPFFTRRDFKSAYQEHIKSLCRIRLENAKTFAETFQGELNCVCGSSLSERFTVCNLCRTAYHPTCFKIDENIQNGLLAGFQKKLLCSYCTRTKRPSLEEVQKLFLSGQKLKIKIPEVIALSYYLNIVLRWQQGAESILKCSEIVAALDSVISQKAKVQQCHSYESIKERFKEWSLKKKRLKLQESSNPESRYPQFCLNPNFYAHFKISSLKFLELRQTLTIGDSLEISTQLCDEIWILVNVASMRLIRENMVTHLTEANETETLRKKSSPEKLKSFSIKKHNNMPLKKKTMKSQLTRRKRFERAFKNVKMTKFSNSIVTAKKRGRKKNNLGGKKNNSNGVEKLPEEHEPEEICAAEHCVKPPDLNVIWLQCDGCLLWFHLKCVNFVNKDVIKDDFVCQQCLEKKRKSVTTLNEETV